MAPNGKPSMKKETVVEKNGMELQEKAPAKETNGGSPVKETNGGTPTKQTNGVTPAEQTNGGTPAKETPAKETPAKGKPVRQWTPVNAGQPTPDKTSAKNKNGGAVNGGKSNDGK
jgi:hypothetical protein